MPCAATRGFILCYCRSMDISLDVVQPVPWCVDIFGDSIAIGCSDGSVVVRAVS